MEGTDWHRVRVAVWWCSRFIGMDGKAIHSDYVNGLNRNNIPSIAVLQREDKFVQSARSMFLKVYTSKSIDEALPLIMTEFRLKRDEIVLISDTGRKGMLDPEEVPLLYHGSAGVLGSEVTDVIEYRKAASRNESEECIRLLRQIYHRYRYMWALLDLVERLSITDPKEAFEIADRNAGIGSDMDYKLALFHLKGVGTEVDPGKYLECLHRAYTEGSSAAGYEWVEYVIDNSLEQHYNEALRISQGSDVRSKANLARMYHDGLGVDRDLDEAIELMRFASSKGVGNTVNTLSDYLLERGGDEDVADAHRLMSLSASVGDLGSKVRLARMFRDGVGSEKDLLKASSLYIEASSLPSARQEMAELSRTIILAMTRKDISKDRNSVLEKLSDMPREDAVTVRTMVTRYDIGTAVNVYDGSVDIGTLESAVMRGNKSAAAELASRYRKEGDLDRTILYSRLSLSSDVGGSVNTLIDDLLRRGTPEDLSDAFVYAARAYGKGDAWSAWRLGEMYLEGIGVNKDMGKASELMKYAASRGVTPAIETVERLEGE